MINEKSCPICGKLFLPSKYRPNQTVCSSLECQHKRQLNNVKEWRNKSKKSQSLFWKEARRQKYLDWYKKHQGYLKLYREEHRERYRNYMKDYMRKYKKNKLGGEKDTN